jgi:light-regulated signal transduction histidine kinase (bacteriophytochrome)
MEYSFIGNSNMHLRIEEVVALLSEKEKAQENIPKVLKILSEFKKQLLIIEGKAANNETRINRLLEVLLKCTVQDFSDKLQISELGDDLDAIAVGINTLAEELSDKIRIETENAAKLRDQNITLERINHELASFAYISSHDLQEPLRKINTYISRLQAEEEANLSEQSKFYLERISFSASRMQKLIRDILDYSRLSKTDQKDDRISLREAVEECREEFEEVIAEQDIDLSIGELPDLKIVDKQFKRVISNLLGNSVKFKHPDRRLKITIYSAPAEISQLDALKLNMSKKYCVLHFEDNGIGFSPEYNEKIFEVFQRLHSQSEYEGTGVGLSICKRIVENHGGAIKANGKAGEGVRFDIWLPMN